MLRRERGIGLHIQGSEANPPFERRWPQSSEGTHAPSDRTCSSRRGVGRSAAGCRAARSRHVSWGSVPLKRDLRGDAMRHSEFGVGEDVSLTCKLLAECLGKSRFFCISTSFWNVKFG